MRNLRLGFAIIASSSVPALADCAFGGPCGDGSPYGQWNERWGADQRGGGFGESSEQNNRFQSPSYGFRRPSYGNPRRSLDDDE